MTFTRAATTTLILASLFIPCSAIAKIGSDDDTINPKKRPAATLDKETDEVEDESSLGAPRHQDLTPDEEIRLANEAIDRRHERILEEQRRLWTREFSFYERQNAELNLPYHNIWLSSPMNPESPKQ